ncbi:MAG: UDP-N-acetylmuramoyl-L-alanine--D-glutamate ligase [bacterium]|nr:UDP-N-acetylmuramoyl-L-alanine--D-glutamate ligase [bacterium]
MIDREVAYTAINRPRKVAVIGGERSGIAAAKLLQSLGIPCFLSDIAQGEKAEILRQKLLALNIPFELGEHSDEIFRGTDLIVTSPGVDSRSKLFVRARDACIPVWSELEFAWRLNPGKTIAISGTNGKSTTTTWLGEIFRSAKIPHVVAGNIGVAFSDCVHELTPEHWAILEVSSFQLEWIEKFQPDVAVLLNLAPDHLYRYDSLQQYYLTKRAIALHQTSKQVFVGNANDVNVELISKGLKSSLFPFSGSHPLERGVWLGHDRIYLRDTEPVAMRLASFDNIHLFGRHNLVNAAAVVAAAYSAGIEPEAINAGLFSFKGLPHRLELVPTTDGFHWYNDSKATTPDSTRVALLSFPQPVIWLAGGYDKGIDFTPLKKLVKRRVTQLIAFGAARDKVKTTFSDIVPIVEAETLREAVELARKQAQPGVDILLSPMCASFDEFNDFEDRGTKYAEYVRGITQ